MRKILVRSGMSPFDVFPYEELRKRFGQNSGNLVYAYGAFRMLCADANTELVSTYYRTIYSEEEIERINAEYDMFVLPLANVLRARAEERLERHTRLVRSLKIPCVVVGMGIQAPYEPGKDLHYPFDEQARDFVREVLEKSALIGVRGEITADYLSRLGFQAERDFTVIGCPSMYTFGKDLGFRPLARVDAQTRVSYNLTPAAPASHVGTVMDAAKSFSDAIFIPQEGLELELMRTGAPLLMNTARRYPRRITDEPYRQGNARFFGNAKTWIDFQRGRDLCFGTRMHGNITAVLAGTPTVFLPIDARMRELIEYHGFAHIPPENLHEEASLRDWIGKLDLASPLRNHARNFAHYVDFLARNGIRNSYESVNGGGLEFERRMESVNLLPPLECMKLTEPAWKVNLPLYRYTIQRFRERVERKARTVASKLRRKNG